MNSAFVLNRAAFIASRYDRNAKDDVRYNRTNAFHLCGLIERAATKPKSGATHRAYIDGQVIDEAKAAFCRAHGVAHPSVWEWAEKRTCEQVRDALHMAAYKAGRE